MKNIFANEKSFTFNNFDELKGFLKDKYILVSSEEENERLSGRMEGREGMRNTSDKESRI